MRHHSASAAKHGISEVTRKELVSSNKMMSHSNPHRMIITGLLSAVKLHFSRAPVSNVLTRVHDDNVLSNRGVVTTHPWWVAARDMYLVTMARGPGNERPPSTFGDGENEAERKNPKIPA